MDGIRSIWLVSMLATTAFAQTPCAVPNGPDMIVADIASVANYTASGGLDAAFFGETTCNIGTGTVTCSATTAQHPIHVQGLFRYEVVAGAGRFEQIGMSWCSHDFFELEQASCCACSPVGGGNLGPGCSTSSTATVQGSQSQLGKRFDVNAFTGTFPFPVTPGTSASQLARRLQFAFADVDPAAHSGALFFAEAALVTPDDALASNGANNASHRPLTMLLAGTDVSLVLSAATVREKAAIWAWQTVDPQVHVQVAQVPNEGVFLVASRATDLGGGLWRYEYAVENVNSDVACGAFRVPLGSGAQLTGVGFHDVAYHSGDGTAAQPIDGTDWSATTSASEIAWSTVPYGTSPTGNGLRFATLYNFRFDANAPPQMGTVTLDTWKVAGSVNAAAWVPGVATPPGVPYCFGDGSGVPCPCGNDSPPGSSAGCLNSLGTGGLLGAVGISNVANDTLVLQGTQMASSSCLYFQGTTQTAGGVGIPFGDGLRCASGSIVRLGIKTNVGGASQYPSAGDVSISVRGGCMPGNVRTYQVWYRNSAPFCTPSTFNLTNGVVVTWT
jgi:hypothetical protein